MEPIIHIELHSLKWCSINWIMDVHNWIMEPHDFGALSPSALNMIQQTINKNLFRKISPTSIICCLCFQTVLATSAERAVGDNQNLKFIQIGLHFIIVKPLYGIFTDRCRNMTINPLIYMIPKIKNYAGTCTLYIYIYIYMAQRAIRWNHCMINVVGESRAGTACCLVRHTSVFRTVCICK